MSEASPSPPPPWRGWHRPTPTSAWREVCGAATDAECWRLLLDAARGGELMVLRDGRHPADTRVGRPRAGGRGRR
jgi:hypothetical protein